MMFVLTERNACKDGSFNMLCVVWAGRTYMICQHMRTDAVDLHGVVVSNADC
jgi:hypothetical protein